MKCYFGWKILTITHWQFLCRLQTVFWLMQRPWVKYLLFVSEYLPHCVKPWLNGVASRRKLKTWIYLRLRLARSCLHLRWLGMTCVHFDQICMQVKATFSSFGHPTQVNESRVTSINLLLAKLEDMFFLCVCDLRVLTRKLASPFGHPTQVSTQVKLASTCDYFPVRLTRASLVICLVKYLDM